MIKKYKTDILSQHTLYTTHFLTFRPNPNSDLIQMRCLVRVLKAFRTYNFRHLGALGLKMMLKRDVAAATGAAGAANDSAALAVAQVS